jgi:hypothetical protein
LVAEADPVLDKIRIDYPGNQYIVGIGEANRTGNSIIDKRIADIMARREIASQIRVRIKEETVDIMCEGGAAGIFKDKGQCQNAFVSMVEATVDEFLKGSKIVDRGQKEGVVYSVAVMARKEAVEKLDKNIDDSISKTRENIKKAEKGNPEAAAEAREEYLKARAYDKEREVIGGVMDRSSDMFDELEKDIEKLME